MKNIKFDPRSAWKMTIDPVETGKAWRRKRRELNLSQDLLSDIFESSEIDGIGMSKAAISAVENGKHVPSIHNAFFFASLCGCPVEELIVTYGRAREATPHDQLPDQNKNYENFLGVSAHCDADTLFLLLTSGVHAF